MKNPKLCIGLVALGTIFAGLADAWANQSSSSSTSSPAADERAEIKVGRSTLISADETQTPHGETFVAVNPRDATTLLATSTVWGSKGEYDALYGSHDGGATWARLKVGSSIGKPMGADPALGFSPGGIAYFAEMANIANRVVVLVHRSLDNGRTWSQPVNAAGVVERPYIAFDDSDGPFHGTIYIDGRANVFDLVGNVQASNGICFSFDGGKDFIPGYSFVGTGDGQHPVGLRSDLLVAPDGDVIMPSRSVGLSEPAKGTDSTRVAQWWLAVSHDGGKNFEPTRPGPKLTTAFEARTADGSRSAIDLSQGPHRARVFVSIEAFEEGQYKVGIAHTDDLGRTWSEPAFIDSGSGLYPSNTTIAVNKNGVVGVSWYDRRNDPDGRCHRLYFSASLDGGDHWLPSVAGRTVNTCLNTVTNSQPMVMTSPMEKEEGVVEGIYFQRVSNRFANGGDTMGLVADANGIFHAAWIGGDDSGPAQLWHTTFEVVGGPVIPGVKLAPAATPTTDHQLLSDLRMTVTNARVDWETRVATVDVYVTNRAHRTYTGPFTLRQTSLASEVAQTVNAENGESGVGATWTITAPGDGKLRPGERSNTIQLKWKYLNVPSVLPGPDIQAEVILERKRSSSDAANR
jgi:hypothetical protein